MKIPTKLLTALALMLALVVVAVPAITSDDSNTMLGADGSTPETGDGSGTDTTTDTTGDTIQQKDYVEFLKDNLFLALILIMGILALAYGIHDDTNAVIILIGVILTLASAACLYGAWSDIDIINTISDWVNNLTSGGSADETA